MKTVSAQAFHDAFDSIAEALAAAGSRPPARPGLAGRWEQDASGRLHCRWTARPAGVPDPEPTAADRAAHAQALGVSR